MHRLLLIDDDEALAGPLTQYLARFDLQLEAVTRPSAALARQMIEKGILTQDEIDARVAEVRQRLDETGELELQEGAHS